jgi:hypothetical protein
MHLDKNLSHDLEMIKRGVLFLKLTGEIGKYLKKIHSDKLISGEVENRSKSPAKKSHQVNQYCNTSFNQLDASVEHRRYK